MASFQISKNLAQSTLASGYTAGNTTITVQTGDGAKFDSPNFVVAIGNPPQFFLRVTGVSTDTFTVDSTGFDGSTVTSVGAGVQVTEVITAGVLQALLASAGGLVLLEEHTASASAEIDFTTRNATGQSGASLQSDFDDYLIEITCTAPASSGQRMLMQFSTNGGSSYDTGGNYQWASAYSLGFAGAGGNQNNGGDSGFQIGPGNLDASTTWGGMSASISLHGPAVSSYKHMHGQSVAKDGGDAGLNERVFGGMYLSSSSINAFRFIMTSTDNIASGTFRLYGRVK